MRQNGEVNNFILLYKGCVDEEATVAKRGLGRLAKQNLVRTVLGKSSVLSEFVSPLGTYEEHC